MRSAPSNMMMNQPNPNQSIMPIRGVEEIPKPPVVARREISYAYVVSFMSHMMFYPSHCISSGRDYSMFSISFCV
jgi:hypothetical protein